MIQKYLTILLVGFLYFSFVTGAGADDSPDFQAARLQMVARQIEARGVTDPPTLAAMRAVKRHAFVPENQRSMAYLDMPLPIGHGQTISQPYMVACMTEVLALRGKEKVLEIGTGSGYQAAVLAETAGEVYSVEIIPPLHRAARERLKRQGYDRVHLLEADGYYGWPKAEPFDRIIVTCAAGHIPQPLIRQLKPGGRMVIPVGMAWSVQNLVLLEKSAGGKVRTRTLMAVRFVPLVRGKDNE